MLVYLKNLYKYKDLFVELVMKDIKLKYRNSFLGIIWSLLNPLMMTIVMSIIFMTLFKNNIADYPLYVTIGRIIFQFFSESTNFAMNSIHANGQLISKVYVPKYFFPLSKVCSSFITSLIAMITIIIIMLVIGVPFRWMNLLVFIPLLYLFVISAGVGLLLSSINVFFKDLGHLYSIFLMIVMYMTPIFYPDSIIPENFHWLIELNPLFAITEIFRDVIMFGIMPDLKLHIVPLIYMFLFGLLGSTVFYKTQDKFIYHL